MRDKISKKLFNQSRQEHNYVLLLSFLLLTRKLMLAFFDLLLVLLTLVLLSLKPSKPPFLGGSFSVI